MEEIWKDIVIEKNGITYDFTGLYQVSNLGNVRSMNFSGKVGNIKTLKTYVGNNGYMRISISHNGKITNFFVHRLVANAFIPNPDNLEQVNHKDEDKTNNNVENLEWCDNEYNLNYGTRTERCRKKYKEQAEVRAEAVKGAKNPHARKVICIETGMIFNAIVEAAEYYNISKNSIANCVRGASNTAGGYHWQYYE